MKNILILLSMFMVGCSTFQPSTYENQSTAEGNVVIATGRAADNAASSNTTHNCPSCVYSGSRANAGTYGQRTNQRNDSYVARIGNSAVNTAAGEISNEINSSIRDYFRND
jgi:hypothetical protein